MTRKEVKEILDSYGIKKKWQKFDESKMKIGYVYLTKWTWFGGYELICYDRKNIALLQDAKPRIIYPALYKEPRL